MHLPDTWKSQNDPSCGPEKERLSNLKRTAIIYIRSVVP